MNTVRVVAPSFQLHYYHVSRRYALTIEIVTHSCATILHAAQVLILSPGSEGDLSKFLKFTYSCVWDGRWSPIWIAEFIAMQEITEDVSEWMWNSGNGHMHRRHKAWIAASERGGFEMVDHKRLVTGAERIPRRPLWLCLRDATLTIIQKRSGEPSYTLSGDCSGDTSGRKGW
jgi:hypothetical protein